VGSIEWRQTYREWQCRDRVVIGSSRVFVRSSSQRFTITVTAVFLVPWSFLLWHFIVLPFFNLNNKLQEPWVNYQKQQEEASSHANQSHRPQQHFSGCREQRKTSSHDQSQNSSGCQVQEEPP